MLVVDPTMEVLFILENCTSVWKVISSVISSTILNFNIILVYKKTDEERNKIYNLTIL